jgi:hypothetical protein
LRHHARVNGLLQLSLLWLLLLPVGGVMRLRVITARRRS